MKFKNIKKFLALVISIIVVFCVTGCDNLKGFELPHFDGSNLDNGYDTDLLYKNNSNMLGGDSGVIWVSEEEGGEEYGGYFYQYMSETAKAVNMRVDSLSGSPYKEDGTPAKDKKEASYIAHILLTRSKDLNNWEVCGAVNGMALKLPAGRYENKDWKNGCWIGGDIWAPECIYDKVSKQYYLYFSASMYDSEDSIRNYDGKAVVKESDANYSKGKVQRPWNMFGAVAVSKTPVGPFELVTSENYKTEENSEGKNPNGEILTLDYSQFNFQKYLGDDHLVHRNYFADLSPFIDENGDLYMYYARRTAVNGNTTLNGLSTWGVKMKDFATPDYSTISLVVMTEKSEDRSFHPVKSIYKGQKDDGLILPNGDVYESAEGFINDSDYPRWDINSWEHICEWDDGTKNTELNEDGSKNSSFNGTLSTSKGSVDIREGVSVFTNKDKNGKTIYYAKTTMTGVQSADYDEHWVYSSEPLGNTTFEYPKNTGMGTILGVDQSNDFMSNLGHSQIIKVGDEWWISHWEWTVPFFNGENTDIGRIQAITQMVWIEDSRSSVPVPVANGPTKTLQPLPYVATGYRNVASRASITAKKCEKDTIKYLNDGHVVTMTEWENREFVANNKCEITLKFDNPTTIRGILIYNSYNKDYAFSNIDSIQFELAENPSWYNGKSKYCYINNLGFDSNNYYPGKASIATFNEIKVNKITIKINSSLSGGKTIHVSDICVLGK